MKINEIHLNPDNPRFIKDDRFEKLKNNIKEFPKMMKLRPIIIDDSNKIIGGNMRYRALIELGYSEIPEGWVVKASELTEEEKERFIITDNIPYGDWDYEKLGNEWDEVKLEDWGMDLSEINIHFEPEAEEDDFDIDKAVEDAKEPICKLGDIWQLGKHRIMCGDSTKKEDVEKLMDRKKADMVFTDPPYNVNYGSIVNHPAWKRTQTSNGNLSTRRAGNEAIKNDNLSKEDWELFVKNYMEILLKYCDGEFYICMSNKEMYTNKHIFESIGGHWASFIIWHKHTFVLSMQDYHRQYEPIMYGWKEGTKHKWYGGRSQSDVWNIDKPRSNELHPTQKPIELCSRAIQNNTKKEMIVLDSFLGSGSTLIACEQLNRICYGMEIDPMYCDVVIRRWEEYTKQKAEKLNA